MTPQDEIKKILERAEVKPIPSCPGYGATADGSVWSFVEWRGQKLRKLSTDITRCGYLRVRIMFSGRRVNRSVHRLVCEAFNGKPPSPTHEVRHLDGTRINNRANNLAWGTKSENAKDRQIHGTDAAPKNGRAGAHKLIKNKCIRGHDYSYAASGRKRCPECDRTYKKRAKMNSRQRS